jgi:hypothetical protein
MKKKYQPFQSRWIQMQKSQKKITQVNTDQIKSIDPKLVKKRLKAFLAQHPEWDGPETDLTDKQLAQQKFLSSIRHSEQREKLEHLLKQPHMQRKRR